MVPRAGIEPALPKKSDFESDVSTSFTTPAQNEYYNQKPLIMLVNFYDSNTTATFNFFIAFFSSCLMRSADTLYRAAS